MFYVATLISHPSRPAVTDAMAQKEILPVELMWRLKKTFDPQNVFSPGRFAGGI